jgi:hypothetical protein
MRRSFTAGAPALLLLAIAVALAGCGGGSDSTTASRPFSPNASLKAVGGTARTEKPAFVLTVDARPGDENILAASVMLPKVVLVDSEAITGFCTEKKLKADSCKGEPKLGAARVLSPAYETPLTGSVYAVTGSGRRLPRLAYLLHSGSTEVVLRGEILSEKGQIGASVEGIPDTPLKTFELKIDGGSGGYLILSRDLCKAEADAEGTFTSQAEQRRSEQVPLEASCST